MFRVPRILFLVLFLLSGPTAALCGELPKDVLEKIDAAIAAAYKTASAKQPCKIGTGGKLHMLRWQDVDKCLSQAVSLVDWDALSRQLEEIRPKNVSEGDFAAEVEKSLTKNALPYDRVFKVKDEKALLPLTNPVLKHLPPNSLQDQPVIEPYAAHRSGPSRACTSRSMQEGAFQGARIDWPCSNTWIRRAAFRCPPKNS